MYTLSATGLCLRPFGERDVAAFAAAARESAMTLLCGYEAPVDAVTRHMPPCGPVQHFEARA